MLLNYQRVRIDQRVNKLQISVRNNVKLFLSVHSLNSLEAEGVGAATPYTSLDGRKFTLPTCQPFGSSSIRFDVLDCPSASPRLFKQLYSKGRTKRLENKRLFGPSTVFFHCAQLDSMIFRHVDRLCTCTSPQSTATLNEPTRRGRVTTVGDYQVFCPLMTHRGVRQVSANLTMGLQ